VSAAVRHDGRMETWIAAGLTLPSEVLATAEQGAQTAGDVELGAFADGTFGVWEISEGVSTDVEADEVSVILSGRGTVEDLDTGAVVGLAPGTVLRLRAGERTRWTITERVRKVYVVR
jgi:uncharacterized protein